MEACQYCVGECPVGFGMCHCGCGEIPDGLVLRHKCDNRPCVNPDHLTPGTKKQNLQDCIDRGRFWGAHPWSQPLSLEVEELVISLYLSRVRISEIAERSGCSRCHVFVVLKKHGVPTNRQRKDKL